jgi:uncharacterized protein YqgV (UPF0045/DUF77 family)
MATAALRRRDAAAAKLNDSTRQLRRYLDGENQVERIILQKSDKVDLDREELVAKHIEYSERTDIDLTDHEMKTFIEKKVDDAVDLVDEATLKIRDLRANFETAAANAVNARKLLEQTTMKLHSESCQRLVQEIIEEINEVAGGEEQITTEVNKVKSAMIELDKAEQELNKSWNDQQATITDETEMTTFMNNVEAVKSEISSCRRTAGAFTTNSVKTEAAEGESESATTRRTQATKFHKLPRISPPKFSRDIRDYARFKGDFERIVEKEYDDEVHKVCNERVVS